VQPETDAPMDLQEGGESFRNRVIHPWMFRAYMLAKMPVLGVTGMYLTEIDTRRCEGVVPYGWGTKNLYGRIFDSAVLAAAETASLALLILHVRNQSAPLEAELRSVRADVESAPDGEDLRVRCSDGHRYADFVRRAAGSAPRDCTFEARAETRSGEVSHDVELRWELRSDE